MSITTTLTSVESFLEHYLVGKAPALPVKWKEWTVKWAPWFELVTMLLVAPVLLTIIGLNTIIAPLSFLGGISSGVSYSFYSIFLIVVVVLQVISIPGLLKKTRKGWQFAFYATLANALYAIFQFNFSSLLFGVLLPLYFLFQVKSYYTN